MSQENIQNPGGAAPREDPPPTDPPNGKSLAARRITGKLEESIAQLGDLVPDYGDDDKAVSFQPAFPGSVKWPRHGKKKRQLTDIQVQAEEKRRQFVALRIQGHSNAEIARQFDVSAKTVSRVVTETMRRSVTEDVEQLREIIVARNDALIKALWPIAIGGNFKVKTRKGEEIIEQRAPDLIAIDRIVKLNNQIAELKGLKVPPPSDNQDGKSGQKSPLDPRVAEAMTIAAARTMQEMGRLKGPEDDPGPEDPAAEPEGPGEGQPEP